MADYDNKNTFALFRNQRKEKPTHPDFSGTFVGLDGQEYFIDAWSKTPKSGGEKFLSGRIGKLKDKQGEKKTPPSPPKAPPVMDDEIPF